MRIGQTSFIVFVSKFAKAALGFVATIYFARVLGAEILGYYALILALVAWLELGGKIGISTAITKRLSEGEDQSAYFTAGVIAIGILAAVLSVGVVVFRDAVNEYVGVEAAVFVVFLLVLKLIHSLLTAVLQGEHLVHIYGLLDPLKTGSRAIIQIGLVFAGFGLTGMIVGKGIGVLIASLVALVFVSVTLTRPSTEHFRSLFDYAKYSWLGNLESRSFNDVDIVILGALVSPALVGIYSVAWSIAKFLTVFGTAVKATLFPELSVADAEGDSETVSALVSDALTYGGLVIIPGLFGAILLGDRLLLLYGSEFVQGTAVLGVLIVATLARGYQKQLVNVLNGIDRPDVAFRVNAVAIVANVVLNVVLILWLGWLGAAIATALSATIGLSLSLRELHRLVAFDIPYGELARQLSAAVVMAVIVFGGQNTIEATGILEQNVVILVLLVAVGAGTYFVTLFTISRRFRSTVVANSPVRLPLVS
ncbi:polysaccharide biosynthesis protein [Natrialba chahannaoensis JCM 10990]|uniref:Polysaccharide biosynthesis protein n=1 Tax=Natrialba chahannaoensis JCM 10990 TaxID=1227492 RepID=M0AH53_9EURY|nr:polysaccharide biosynthesis C-terminal domain-containing protein [Natrialba chahannaoensis]ELY96713.1 polysaccharide biosynthesis protein [Natrialba chahannaoensis JCM 10990]